MTFTLRMRGTRAASGARTCRMRMLIASEHERLFFECYCASRWHHRCAATVENEDFGTSSFFGQLSGKPLLASWIIT